jgi:hypothetical protein
MLKRLWKTELQVNIKRSEFKVIYTKYLGFIILTISIKVNKFKTEVIKN